MVKRLFWVRHGPTHQTACTGWRDVPADLSDTDAIARLSAHLPADAHLVSSDLTRAVTTADAIGGARPRLAHERDLREFDFGAWDGLHFDTITARDPNLSRRFWEEPGETAPPDGESWNAVAARVSATIARLMTDVPGDLVAVSHFGAILTHLSQAGGIAAKAALSHRIDTLSVTELHLLPDGWRIAAINHHP
ncbi:Phosphoglycerate mutase family protein [Roseibacterium elongatum DSM 19469]|uniref:Phosphoglycerate mutase family protein n=1 Tax=Roseicyclus elongatus DSM 19469 TaxID=1294273 RepID=W8SK12_9RHOB|nr:histidine phosphatase family protein [Roseibacterium elongatum]AHM02845.1 Phosphoglycerate mutase family protein [Roseibacterium elongatum DSM 19469]